MSKDVSLSVEERDVLGKKVKQLRVQGKTPAVIHDHGKPSVHVSIDEPQLRKVFANAGKHHPVEIDLKGKKYTTLIKEMVYAPARRDILHTVFQAIKADEKVDAEVPVRLIGDAPAEKAGLLVLKQLEHIEIEALPKDLLDVFEISQESLAEIGDKLHVSDLKIPAEVTVKTDMEQVIAAVEEPRVHEIETPEAEEVEGEEGEEGAEGAEGETPEGEETSEKSEEGSKEEPKKE